MTPQEKEVLCLLTVSAKKKYTILIAIETINLRNNNYCLPLFPLSSAASGSAPFSNRILRMEAELLAAAKCNAL